MKGNPDLILTLKARLAIELGTINRYMVHAGICEGRLTAVPSLQFADFGAAK